MKVIHWIVLLLALTLGMQSVILYRDYRRSKPKPPVQDVPKGTSLELDGLPVEGAATARVALVEFSDYECPYCVRHTTGVGREIAKEFINTGKVRHAFVNYPLPIHANAKFLATSAICAGNQGQYWQMHDLLFDIKPKVESEILALTSTLGLNLGRFKDCLKRDSEPARVIARDLRKANEFKFNSTPSFAIGVIGSDSDVAIQTFIIGAQPIEAFRGAIQRALSQASTR